MLSRLVPGRCFRTYLKGTHVKGTGVKETSVRGTGAKETRDWYQDFRRTGVSETGVKRLGVRETAVRLSVGTDAKGAQSWLSGFRKLV